MSCSARLCACTVASSHNSDNNLIKHNLVVFRNGENALQVLPPLVDVIPEARLNLVIYHLRRGETTEVWCCSLALLALLAASPLNG